MMTRSELHGLLATTWLLFAIACSSGGAADDGLLVAAGGTDSGPKASPKASWYDACNSTSECESGECLVRQCTLACETDDDCPDPISSQDYNHVFCGEHGWCQAFRCTGAETDHNKLVAGDMLCLRGELVACADLDPRPCSCLCSSDQYCYRQHCEDKVGVGSHCDTDAQCTTGFCRDDTECTTVGCREASSCRTAPGEPCQGGDEQCDAICNAPGVGMPGICLARCDCQACADCPESQICRAGACRSVCHADGDCETWERCEFESQLSFEGICASP